MAILKFPSYTKIAHIMVYCKFKKKKPENWKQEDSSAYVFPSIFSALSILEHLKSWTTKYNMR